MSADTKCSNQSLVTLQQASVTNHIFLHTYEPLRSCMMEVVNQAAAEYFPEAAYNRNDELPKQIEATRSLKTALGVYHIECSSI
ncbi:hypothetical protein GQ600_9664 [Phytophthora cactorum]|nr:hypothetical protein GQ600_9664 [Phytophthora cactorum]